MSYKTCQHVRENGIFCDSPSVRGRNYCYYHARIRARRLAMAKARAERRAWPIDIPPLEDMYAVQASLSNVLEAIAAGSVDPKRGGLILYGLQQAANNARMPGWGIFSHYGIHDEDDGRVVDYPGLEAEFGLPKNIDMDAVPGEAFPSTPDPWEFPPRRPVLDEEALKIWKNALADQERKLLNMKSA